MAQTVGQVMTRDPVNLPPSATLVEAALAMRGADTGDVVIALEGQARGIVTDRDIVIRAVAEGRDPAQVTVGEIATRDVESVTSGDELEAAIRLMRERKFRRVPVVEEGQPVGILSIGDLAVERDADSALAEISAADPNR